MERRVALLRGINVGPNKRIAMPALRDLLTGAGFGDVQTYVQSGNVVLSTELAPADLEREFERLISEEFGFDVDVVTRSRGELAEVVERNPFAEFATDPKRYQVSFLSAELEPQRVEALAAVATESERFVSLGRELYAWHPDGVARSRLWARLAAANLGVKATARNWTTVTTLLAMADP
jgi:uncharacterized protein (DUF1697 family)